MAVHIPPRHHTPASDSSRGSEVGHTIVVKTASSNTDSAPSSEQSSPNERIQSAASHSTPNKYPLSNGVESSHKRKHSGVDDIRGSSLHRQYDYSPPKRAEHPQHMADRALHVLDDPHAPQYYSNGHNIDTNSHWSRDQDSQPPSAASGHPNGSHDQQWEVTTPTNGQGYEHDPSVNGANGVRKRKRNFANRTKTGCLTCRKRKKKCDEGRPNCQNCVRGGYPCEGYSTARPQGIWARQTGAKTPVPLQSKDGQTEEPPPRPQNNSPGPNRPYENGHVRPVTTDALERPSHLFATTNVSEPRNRPPYPGQAWPPQQSQQYTKDPLPLVAEVGHSNSPSREMSRPPTQGSGAPLPQTAPPPPQHPPPVSQPAPQYPVQAVPQQTHAPPAQTSYYQSQSEYRPSYPTPSAQPTASEYRHASTHGRISSSSYRTGSKHFGIEEVERSKMTRGGRYNRLDPTLVDDRKRCKRALARYNAACEVDSGMDDEEARNMLWKVFDPGRDNSHNFRSLPEQKGTLSHGVKIEPPFHCTYGYNLKIMDSVYIGENTSIDDSHKVEIGPRTSIGANVRIMTNAPCKDMVDRKGSGGAWEAKPVYIASEVIIGDNVIIYPDVRLERGVTVEPGAIVKESAPENAVLRAPAAARPPFN